MSDTPKNERVGKGPSLRPGSRGEALAALLDSPLEDEAKVLEALVTALGAEEGTGELFDRLHEAAVQQERSANLSFAYERIARDSRLKLLPKPKQAEFYLHAARFFANVFGDADAAIAYAERSRQLAPEESAVFDQLETLLAGSQQGKKLAKLYAEQATQITDPDERLRLLSAAIELSETYGGTLDEAATLYEQILDVDPTNVVARGTLEGLYVSARRFKDLADLLERSVARAAPESAAESELRLRLVALYRGELRDPARGAPHVETLLGRTPIDPAALQAAEALVDHRPIAPRVAPLLSEAYQRLGRLEDEASTLALELKFARPPRLAEVHRRLAILRQDVLSDPAGALELLEPLVARDPTDDDLRRRYLEVNRTFHRELEAAKLLSRAAPQVKDAAGRARVNLEIAALYAKLGDARRARTALAPAHDEAPDDTTRLVAAKQIVELTDDASEPKLLARALETLILLDSELPVRSSAAKRLAELCDGPVRDPKLAIVAWRALLGSPRGDEALDRLEALYAAAGDESGTIEVLFQRAQRSKEPKKAAAFAFKATELRAARAESRAAALKAWRAFSKAHGPSREAHTEIAKLLEQERDFSGLAKIIEADIALAPRAERPALLGRLAHILFTELKDAPRALDALQAAINEDPKDAQSRKTLERLLAAGEHRIDAAGILEPLYRSEKNHAGLVRVLEARADMLTDETRRLAALDEAFRVAESALSDPNRALELSGRAVRQAARHVRSELEGWFERFRRAAEKADNPARRAELLALAITDLPIDDVALVALAREAAEALVSRGDIGRGIETYRQLLALEPSSEELVVRIDELLVEQGSPEERVDLHVLALEQTTSKKRRRELMHSLARIHGSDRSDPLAASEVLKKLVSEYPTDLAAHDALADAFEALGAREELIRELERALSWAEGDRRSATTERLAKALEESGHPARALELYLELLGSDALSTAGTLALADLAEARESSETLALALERHAGRTDDDVAQANSLARLGDVRAKRLSDSAGAVNAYRQAARLFHAAGGDEERTRGLYERILDILPEDREAARYLVDAYADLGNWEKIPVVFSMLLRPEPSHEAIDLALSLEERAISAAAIDAYQAILDEALGRQAHETARRSRELSASKAKAIASDPNRRAEARSIFRGLVESFGDPRDVQSFARFLEQDPLDAASFDDQRWVFSWRAEHETDRATVLEQRAHAEETRFADSDAAISVYAEILEADPGHEGAREALCRLQLERGDAEGLLRTLRSARDRARDDETLEVDFRIASLLVERLDRVEEALPTIQALLERAPDHAETSRIVRDALRREPSRRAVAEALSPVALAVGGAASGLIQTLLEETLGISDLGPVRVDWYLALLAREGSDPITNLELSLSAALDLPNEARLWDFAERLARQTGEPKKVTDAYQQALSEPVSSELGEELGRRFVEFHEEWFDDPEGVQKMLERILELSPRARWALDRLKLLYNAEGRWEDLFSLYDRAIDTSADDDARIDLLDEAAVAAKDLANDATRAVSYLERLLTLRSESRVELMLERLYERTGRLPQLFALLEKRAPSLAGSDLSRMELRLAKIRLDLEDAKGAFAFLERVRARDADEPQTYVLFEALLGLPSVIDVKSTPAPKKKAQSKKKPLDVRSETIRILEARYRATEDAAGLARALEAALDASSSKHERDDRLQELVALYDEVLGDPERAFSHLGALVLSDPNADAPRERLAQLASKMGVADRRAELLVRARTLVDDRSLEVALLREAAAAYEEIGKGEAAAALFTDVLALSTDRATTLAVARTLEPLLSALDRPAARCEVLEKIADTTDLPAERKQALGEAARIAFETLGDPDRAAHAWRARISDEPTDLEAFSGLARVLETSKAYAELADVLVLRSTLVDRDAARADRVRVAHLFAGPIEDLGAAIETWRKLRADFGEDAESFEALSALLESESRWEELAELLSATAGAANDDDERALLFRKLGDLHRDRTTDADRALSAYVKAGDFKRAQTAADGVSDRDAIERFATSLLERAREAWNAAPSELVSDVAEAAHFAIQTLVRRYLEVGAAERVVEVELLGASLPFDKSLKRKLKRDAAFATCDRLEDPARAIAILTELFDEDPADDVANVCVTRFARLLDEAGRNAELSALWARQAECRADAGDRAGAAALFARAAEIAETRLGDVDQAIALYRRGAAAGGDASLEALARLHTARGDHRDAADALEWFCGKASREELAARSLDLARAYLSLGEWEPARARLEHAAATAIDAGNVRKRLAELYREHEEWKPLARLLVEEAERAPGGSRLAILREAAIIHAQRTDSPAESIPLLEQAVEIEPEDPSLRLALSGALRACGRFDESAAVLAAQIARYGNRRPKERATIHLHLGRVALEAGRRAEALSELDVGAKIDPAHPRILYELGRLSLEEGQLPRAERTFRALLLVLRKPVGDGESVPSRAEIYLDLAEIAMRQGEAERSAELVESAFEVALDSEEESSAFERILERSGRRDLLERAVESRLGAAPSPARAARALADLVRLHGPSTEASEEARSRIETQVTRIHRDLESTHEGSPSDWAALSSIYEWLGNSEGAAQALENHVEALLASGTSEDLEPLFLLAKIRLDDGSRFDEGVSLIERALDLGADRERAWSLLSAVLERAPKHPRVLGLLERVARASGRQRALVEVTAWRAAAGPIPVESVREAVSLAVHLGDDALVITVLRGALAHARSGEPSDDVAWMRQALARALLDRGDFHAGALLLENAERLEDSDETRALLLAAARGVTGENPELAATLYERILARDPSSRDAWEPLLDIYRGSGDRVRLLGLIHSTVPRVASPRDRNRLRLEEAALMLKDAAEVDAAIAVLEDILAEDPAMQEAVDLLSEVLERKGEIDKLVGIVAGQLEAAKLDADATGVEAAALKLGALFERHDQREHALDAYSAILDWNPSSRAALRALVRLEDTVRPGSADIADAIERLLPLEEPSAVGSLARRLVEHRARQGDMLGVERALAIACVADPTDAELREQLLGRCLDHGDWGTAADVLFRAAEADRSDTTLLLRAVEAYERAGHLDRAIETLGMVLERSGKDPDYFLERARLLEEVGRADEALSDIEAAHAVDGSRTLELTRALEAAMERTEGARRAAFAIRLVDLLEAEGETTRAREHLGRFLKLQPKHKDAMRRFASLAALEARWDEAAAMYRRLIALEEGPLLVAAAMNLADACEQTAHLQDARGGLERALEAAPDDPDLSLRLQQIYEATGAHQELAHLLLRRAHAETEVAARTTGLLGAAELLLERNGDPNQAFVVLEEVRRLAPENIQGAVLLARAETALGRADEAVHALTSVIAAHRGKRTKELSFVHRELSTIYLEEGDLSMALQALSKAFDLDLKNGELAMQLGHLALDVDDAAIAARAFRSVTMMRLKEPGSPEGASPEAKAVAYYHLSRIAQAQGDVRRARLMASKAVNEDPNHTEAQALLRELRTG